MSTTAMRSSGDDIQKRGKQREDMFLRRLMGLLAKMAKAKDKSRFYNITSFVVDTSANKC